MKVLVFRTFRYSGGRQAAGRLVEFVHRGTNSRADVWFDSAGTNEKDNPLRTDQNGLVWFYVDVGAYDFQLDGIDYPVDVVEAPGDGGEGGTIDPRIGVMSELSTSHKSTIVGAINEINNPSVSLRALYNNAKAG